MSLNIAERQPLLQRSSTRNPRSPRPSQRTSPSTPPQPMNLNFRPFVIRRRLASAAILLSLVFERIAFYGLAGNLVLFLNKDPFKWESYHAIDASLYFFGLCFAMSLVGGWIADSFFGRFKTLVLSYIIYLAGYVFLPLMTVSSKGSSIEDLNKTIPLPAICKVVNDSDSNDDDDRDPFDERCAWLIYITLLLIAVGTGFVKANVAPFGGDQVAAEGQQATLSFFNWFYWSLNLGALIGLSVITYVQQQQSFFYGYLASVCCLGVSMILFVAGRCCYNVRPADGSVLTNIFRIIREAYRQKRRRPQAVRNRSASVLRGGRTEEPDEEDSSDCRLNFLDYAKIRYGGVFHDSIVEDVRQLKKILAIFVVFIPYWLVYFQMQTSFLVQGLHMRLIMSSKRYYLNISQPVEVDETDWELIQNATSVKEHPQLVVAWFAIFDVIIVILLIPLFDRVIYPWLQRRSGHPASISRRMLIGMFFATAAMLVAGVLEHYRLQTFWPYPDKPCRNASLNQIIGDTQFEAANLSILWQIPQYVLIGLSEVFTSVAGLQFAVSVAPLSMKGSIMGLFYFFSGIGSLLGTSIIITLSSTNHWFHSRDYGNINCRLPCTHKQNYVTESCHLDYFFYLLAGIEFLGAVLFVVVSKVYQLDELHRQSCLGHRNSQPVSESSDENPSLLPPRNDPRQPRSIQRSRDGEVS